MRYLYISHAISYAILQCDIACDISECDIACDIALDIACNAISHAIKKILHLSRIQMMIHLVRVKVWMTKHLLNEVFQLGLGSCIKLAMILQYLLAP